MTPIGICSWDRPGADRYSGSVPAAIAAYGFPIATQTALIAAFEQREFTDSVVIDRDTIRGHAHDYDPGIHDMHFGSRGRVCGTVTRAEWKSDHVETALVLCADGECIGWPAVCGNVFRLTRTVERDTAGERSLVPSGVSAVTGAAEPLFALPAEPTSPETVSAISSIEVLGSGGGSHWPGDGGYAVCCAPWFVVPTTPIAAVPEPATWLIVLAGLALTATARRHA